jgi:DNA (cytosine-5)-methyltransferase 1
LNKPNLGDLKEIDWAQVEPVDILTAGYPCQPFSHAGFRKGTDDKRHIFPYILEAISLLRPQLVILENVRGHLSLGFKEVLAGLASIRYDAKWRVVRASDAGAPHRRERLFILAEPTNTDSQRSFIRGSNTKRHKRQSQSQSCQCGKTTTNAQCEGLQRCISKGFRYEQSGEMSMRRPPHPLDQDKLNPKFVEYMMGLPEGWVTDLPLSRTQQLKILGNGVVPQQAYLALELLVGD